MALNNTYRCSVVYQNTFADGEVVNVLDYVQTSLVSPDSEVGYCTELGSRLSDLIFANYLSILSTLWIVDRIDVYNIDQPTFATSVAVSLAGTSAGDVLGPRNAVLARKLTGLRGRSFRGRAFFPSPKEDQQQAGDLTPAFVTAMQAFVDGLVTVTAASANVYRLAVRSEKLLLSTLVTSFDVRAGIATIRGRKTQLT